MSNCKFTVFTPTYKGRTKLYAVYKCLTSQTFNDFEWIIVLDGEDSETLSIVKDIKNKAPFFVDFFVNPHNHKKSAINRGIQESNGDFFIIADDDDFIKSDALEVLHKSWLDIPEHKKNEFVGVTGLCEYENGDIVGDLFPEDIYDATSLECTLKSKISGEKWGFQRIEIMKNFPFFEDAEGYVGESTVWHEIGKKYKTRYINKVVRTYNQTENSIIREPLNKGKVVKNCQAYVYGYRYSCGKIGRWVLYNPRFYIACSVNYVRFYFHCLRLKKTKSWMNPFNQNFLSVFSFFFALPVGFVFFVKDLILIDWDDCE